MGQPRTESAGLGRMNVLGEAETACSNPANRVICEPDASTLVVGFQAVTG